MTSGLLPTDEAKVSGRRTSPTILGSEKGKDAASEETSTVASHNGAVAKAVKWSRSGTASAEPEDAPWHIGIMVRLAMYVLYTAGVFADFLRKIGLIKVDVATDDARHKGFAPLDNHFEAVFINHIYRKSSDVVNRPICSVPGSVMRLRDRSTSDYGWTYKYTGTETDVINLGSYNYLGFSHNDGSCAQKAAEWIDTHGLHIGGSRHERGNHQAHAEIESCVARYLGVEDAICFPMGFGTNSMNIPSLADQGSLILSDRLNHASIVLGCRLSGATIIVFAHNDPADCEKKLREALSAPCPKTGKPYNKVLIVLEGIYSMEGTIVNVPGFIEVKKKYGAYLFLDEAHSVGALGPTGRGVVEYWGCDPTDVDVMMGTLTKSFAAAGGYMAGSKKVIAHIRQFSAGPCYGLSMSPPVIAQVLGSMRIMLGEDGTDIGAQKAIQLLRNSRYFRRRLRQMGFLIYGHDDSPVIPLMGFYITKVVAFSRSILKQRVGIVGVAFPAVPLDKARVRFCLSSDHTKEQLDYVLTAVDMIGDETGTKYASRQEFVGETIEY